MKLNRYSKALLIVSILFLLVQCSSKSEDVPVDIEVNDFVWKGLNAYYLWQAEKPDLADTRFTNQNQLNNYLLGFASPENIFENLLLRPTDRFSWIVSDYVALENSFQGITANNGMEFGLVRYQNNPSAIFGYVRYVVPNSDAAAQGITRGMLFNAVNGTELTETNFNDLLFSSNPNYTITIADFNNGNPTATTTSFNLTKTQLQENPILVAKVLQEGAKSIGYLVYNQFASSYDSQLNNIFNSFKAENVTDLIIDLRYNGGGSVNSASYLGSMVTGQFNDQLFSKEIWNTKVQEVVSEDSFVNNFTDRITKTNTDGNIIVDENINSLNLSRVYIIVSGSSASASELLINSLRAYIDVQLIGTTTVGKQVGSITLYDSDNLTRSGANLNNNHTYAIQPIVLEISNKNNKNEPNGFTPGVNIPGISIAENYGNLGVLGERSDPLLNRTLTYITTGARVAKNQKREIFTEIYNSKLATPANNNMYVDFK